ncbi:DUF4374 domain-containing protein [Prevotella sp. 10(H)]|uniref:DUF4374 domain-containing protein n=1 Tax=Prevotella sp. 10(H) TaxID=1158294 RepID=UPI0004A6EF0D|nr:DUF4374 domain-containing protein [Prevotella sp. 10(H)]
MNNKYINKTLLLAFSCCIMLFTTSCDEFDDKGEDIPNRPYVLALGITTGTTTAYYIVTTDDLMSGTINAVNKGIEQNGFHDYEQGNQTIFCVGGLGVTNATGVVRGTDGLLYEKDQFSFDESLRLFSQIDNQSMLGMEIPDNAESGDMITFYEVDIDGISISKRTSTPIAPISSLEWPSPTGLCRSGDNIYMTYFHMNPKDYETKYTDTAYVAVYSYPDMTFKKLMKDTRTGPAGSWYAHNGLFKDETGNVYIMSNSSIANGFSQATKTAAFLRIPEGTTEFDDYYFDFEAKSGGLKPIHIKYIGDDLLFAEVSTIKNMTAKEHRWKDNDLKCCIIDLKNQTVTDIKEIPVHNGNGGRRFAVLVDDGYVYVPITENSGRTFIYKVDPKTATAEKGAGVLTNFVAGFFKVK